MDLPGSESGSSDAHLQLEDILENVSNYQSIEKTACYELDMDEMRLLFEKIVCIFTLNFHGQYHKQPPHMLTERISCRMHSCLVIPALSCQSYTCLWSCALILV